MKFGHAAERLDYGPTESSGSILRTESSGSILPAEQAVASGLAERNQGSMPAGFGIREE